MIGRMIALKNVTKAYGKKVVLSNLTIKIEPGSCLCIVGDSESGKTTLMKLLIRAEDPTSGSVDVDGVNIQVLPTPILQLYRKRVGVIFQEPILLDHLTLEENVGMPLELLDAPNAVIRRNVRDLLKRMELLSKADAYPHELTKGERALACIARAIVAGPMVVLADEPFAHLDKKQIGIVTELLANMHKKNTTLVFFSRDVAIARAFKAQVLQLKDGNVSRHIERKAEPVPEDTHRILEENSEDLMSLAQIANADNSSDDVPVSFKPKSTARRIRITSIGSNA